MSSILLHLVAAFLYLALAVLSWRSRWRGAALDRPRSALAAWERAGLIIALLAHGAALTREIFPGDAMHFSFSIAISMILWLAIAFYWVESLYGRPADDRSAGRGRRGDVAQPVSGAAFAD